MFYKISTLLLFVSGVMGHGYIQFPSSRNFERFKEGKDYNFMGLNGGGAFYVNKNSINKTYIYPDTIENGNKRHGMCGDPVGLYEHYNQNVTDYSVVASFQRGQVIHIDIIVTSHHRGHFEFYICDTKDLEFPENGITQECLFRHQLSRAEEVDSISPMDEKYPYRYYLEPTSCMEFQEEPYPGYITTVAYQLPANLTCKHCVLQWWYFTGNSCNHVGYREYQGVNCDTEWYNKELQDCEVSEVKPEEFWNCADISIKRKCKSINSLVSDYWCNYIDCDPIYKDYCSYEEEKDDEKEEGDDKEEGDKEKKDEDTEEKEFICKSIDQDIPDKWCQNVNCDDAYFEYCEREYI
jgi:hypothetical protein